MLSAKRVFVEDNAFLGFRGGRSGWLLPTLATMTRGVRVLANEVQVVLSLLSIMPTIAKGTRKGEVPSPCSTDFTRSCLPFWRLRVA